MQNKASISFPSDTVIVMQKLALTNIPELQIKCDELEKIHGIDKVRDALLSIFNSFNTGVDNVHLQPNNFTHFIDFVIKRYDVTLNIKSNSLISTFYSNLISLPNLQKIFFYLSQQKLTFENISINAIKLNFYTFKSEIINHTNLAYIYTSNYSQLDLSLFTNHIIKHFLRCLSEVAVIQPMFFCQISEQLFNSTTKQVSTSRGEILIKRFTTILQNTILLSQLELINNDQIKELKQNLDKNLPNIPNAAMFNENITTLSFLLDHPLPEKFEAEFQPKIEKANTLVKNGVSRTQASREIHDSILEAPYDIVINRTLFQLNKNIIPEDRIILQQMIIAINDLFWFRGIAKSGIKSLAQIIPIDILRNNLCSTMSPTYQDLPLKFKGIVFTIVSNQNFKSQHQLAILEDKSLKGLDIIIAKIFNIGCFELPTTHYNTIEGSSKSA
jgi:hypothetical protein